MVIYDLKLKIDETGPFSLIVRDTKRKKWAGCFFNNSMGSYEGNDEDMLFWLIQKVEEHKEPGERTTPDTLRALNDALTKKELEA